MTNDEGTNGWPTWAKYVLAEIKRGDKEREENQKAINEMKVEQAKLIVKVAVIVGVTTFVMSGIGTALIIAVMSRMVR